MKFSFQIFLCLLLFYTGVSGESTAQLEGSSHSNEAEADSGLYVRKPRCTNLKLSPEVRVEYIPNYMAPGVQQARRQQPAHVLNHRPLPFGSSESSIFGQQGCDASTERKGSSYRLQS
ncbi:uncharacterized protein LOC124363823 [Homalodisca vitripennis]|uniref:uncharacterized protein LOC124363823 n=1 Tax=Homalodisca vitripennis TaxID=197043 RepID=UPI001EEC6B0F|nr:uncharacterized protein LOC124363823 [Homalodisca vitripennis]